MPPVGELADASIKINGFACRLFLGAWFDSRVAQSSGLIPGWPHVRVAPCSGGPKFGWPSVASARRPLAGTTPGSLTMRSTQRRHTDLKSLACVSLLPRLFWLAPTAGRAAKNRPTFANSLDCGPSLVAGDNGRRNPLLPPTVPSTPRAIPIVRSPQGNSILLQVGTAGAYLGLPPPTRQHSSGDCLIRLAACALLAINRRLTNHPPHRRGGGVEAEVDRVAFDTSFHHGFSTG